MEILSENSSSFPFQNPENSILKGLINELIKTVSYEFSRSPERECGHDIEIGKEDFIEDLTDIAAETEVTTEAESITSDDSVSCSSFYCSTDESESKSSLDDIEIDDIVEWSDELTIHSSEVGEHNLVYKVEPKKTRFRCRFCTKRLVLKDKNYFAEVVKEKNTIAKLHQKIRQHEDGSHPYTRTICKEMCRSRFGRPNPRRVSLASKVKCPFCAKFMCASSIPFHLGTQHKTQKKFKCSTCTQVFGTAAEFLEHFKFQRCSRSNNTSSRRMVKDSVVVPASKCEVCEEIILYKEHFFNHYKIYHPGVLVPSGESCRTYILLQTFELETTNKNTSYSLKRGQKCSICSKLLPNGKSLTNHYKTHNIERLNADNTDGQVDKSEDKHDFKSANGISVEKQTLKEVKIFS